jgi:integrase
MGVSMATVSGNGKRRTRGTGSVWKRGKELWEGRLDMGWMDGKRHYLSVYGTTKLEAEDKLDEARRGRTRGQAPTRAGLTVGRYLDEWQELGCPGKKGLPRPSTLRRYRSVVQYQLIPHLGRIKLAELQPADVEGMLASLRSTRTGKPLAVYTSIHTRSVLRSALSRAERNELVTRNIAKLAGVDAPPKHHPMVLTPEAVVLVLGACEAGLRRLVTVAIDTGLRQGELLGLTWGAVDLEGRILYVRKTLQRVSGTYSLGPPKSEQSERTVALSEMTLQALKDERDAQRAAREAAGPKWLPVIHDLVFTTAEGAPRNGTSVTHSLQSALAAAKLGDMRWHDLRAIHGGLLVQAGVGMSVARDRLGHSSIAVTSDFYTGVVDALQREAADKVGRLLEG